ncbi:hypothetical protein [Desulforhopalus singaporensis]|uniref:Magnetosome protein MamS/MamX domain-containing protein n=1 Tax=Desulforhopalus singaporensis TaxID=91360 RepID=A0A1H0MKX0_9BACT|nr:hypothetical protein [Desulforhopalus singaporensis]SDO81108.1 hypothetical protein SAMN05660330_01095 [Desulforhopalus singaporensis]
MNRIHFFIAPLLFLLLITPPAIKAAEQSNYKGWERESEYNQMYDYKERDSLKGSITKFKKIVPLPGMAPGTAFIIKEGDDEILVHLCPWEFASPKQSGIQTGVKTKVKGSWAVIDDQDVFIAAKVKQGEHFEFKVRLTRDGTPFWTMSPEELAREQQPE